MIWGFFILITAVVLSPLLWILKQQQKKSFSSFSFLSVVGISGIAFSFYALGGSPSFESFPYTSKEGEGFSLNQAISLAEKRLDENPMDGRGWDVIAPIYFRLGRMQESCQAYEKAVSLLGETEHRLADYGEACAFSEESGMSPKARELFEQALRLNSSSLKAHFYLAQAAGRDHNLEKALFHLKAMVDSSPPDAPWVEPLQKMFTAMAERASGKKD
jgi:cytochrome c-type biogenesis protein CcmH